MDQKRKFISIFLVVLFSFCLLPVAGQAALVAHWTFDEGSGTQVVDTVGGLVGTLSPTGADLVSGGKAGGALSLNKATNGLVSMGDVLRFGLGSYSFVAWVKTSTPDPDTTVLSKHWSGITAGYFMGVNSSNTYGADTKAWFYNLSPERSPTSTTSVNDDKWHQIVGVRGGGEVKLYVDGLLEGSQPDQGLGDPYLVPPFLVGGYFNGSNPVSTYTGLIDDIQVYNHMLSPEEVQWLYDHPGRVFCTPAPSGMVSWWGGDNNSLDIIGTNHGTPVNGATYAPGLVGQAFSFDGIDDYINVPSLTGQNFPASFSIDAGVKIFSYPLSTERVMAGMAGGYQLNLLPTGQLKFGFSGNMVISENPIPIGTFVHVAGTVDGNGGAVNIYINGALDKTGTTIPGANSNFFQIGGFGDYSGTFFQGLIDELEIYNRVLSAEEITAIYNAGGGKCRPCTPPPSGMVSWWKGENNANDSMGGNNGTTVGDTAFVAGKVGQAFSFDGAGDYVTIPDHPSLNPTAAITVDAWIFSNNTSYAPPIVKKTDDASGYALELSQDSSQVLFWVNLGSGGSGGWFSSPAGGLTRGIWTHVAGVYDGTSVSLYMNGQLIGSTPAPGAILPSTNNPLNIGWDSSQPTRFFSGLIDEVEIFNRALTAQEIAAIYNAGSTGKCGPEVRLYLPLILKNL